MIICPLCAGSFGTVSVFLTHVRLVHANDASFHMPCGLQGCQRTFSNFYTYRNHVYSFHDLSELENTNSTESMDSTTSMDIEVNESNNDTDLTNMQNEANETIVTIPDMVCDSIAGASTEGNNDDVISRAVALWLLRSRELHNIPQSVMSIITKDIQFLFDTVIDNLKCKIGSIFNNVANIREAKELIIHHLLPSNCHIFQGIETHAKQMSYFRQKFGLVEPKKIKLGVKRIHRGHGRNRRLVEIADTLIYVPLLQSLQTLLKDEGIYTEVTNGHSSTVSGILRDFCDGTYFLSHPLFSTKPNALQICLYYDDVEVCNPLSSSRGKHKLAMFYFMLGNINPIKRSKLKGIQLLALCKHTLIKKYGINKIIKPIVEDIKLLENGYNFDTYIGEQKVFGSLAVVIADNPASCAIGGFKESSSAYCPCRHCLGTAEEIKIYFDEDSFQLRNSETHERHLQEIDDDPSQSREFGINHESLLSDIRYFDICSGALVCDIMHDLLEGVIQYETKLLLIRLIEKRYFKLKNLNSCIESLELPYGTESSKPATIQQKILYSQNSRLNQKAVQMWTLARYLPMLIGQYIPSEDENWINYLTLLDIMDYLVAPSISTDETAHLKVLIEEHHITFGQLYPHASIIPKIHYLIHAPRLISKFGPLSRHWTLRYEAKHKYFKKLSQSIGNYINLPWTLASRHQMLQCYYHASKNSLLEDEIDIGPGHLVAERDRPLPLKGYIECFRPNWIKMIGQKYKPCCIIIMEIDDDYPKFAQIQQIFVVNNKILFEVSVFKTISFCTHFHAYEVKETSTKQIVYTNELSFLYTETLRYHDHKHYVVVRHHIVGIV